MCHYYRGSTHISVDLKLLEFIQKRWLQMMDVEEVQHRHCHSQSSVSACIRIGVTFSCFKFSELLFVCIILKTKQQKQKSVFTGFKSNCEWYNGLLGCSPVVKFWGETNCETGQWHDLPLVHGPVMETMGVGASTHERGARSQSDYVLWSQNHCSPVSLGSFACCSSALDTVRLRPSCLFEVTLLTTQTKKNQSNLHVFPIAQWDKLGCVPSEILKTTFAWIIEEKLMLVVR